MRISISPLAAFTILAALAIWCGDVWIYAWQEIGPPPVSCTTVAAPVPFTRW